MKTTEKTEKNSQKQFIVELQERIKGDVSCDDVILGIYSTDASNYQIKPEILVLPKDEEDVITAVNLAAKYSVNILPRGGGTSLDGQAVNSSMIIDFSKYMNKIIEIDVEHRWVKVQPGLVLDELNAELAKNKLHFAPDPATSSRATIGGMIGNNSSGTKSIYYGITQNHVKETKVLLSDGTILNCEQLSPEKMQNLLNSENGNPKQVEILKRLKVIIDKNAKEIKNRYPKIMRRVQGYNLDAFIDNDNWNLSELIVGSEGTLGTVLEAKLNLEPLPKHKVLCCVHFAELLEAIRSVGPILNHKPSAVEILDSAVLSKARKNLSIAPLCGFIEGEPQAILIVEFFEDTSDAVEQKAINLAGDLKNKKFGYAWPVITESGDQAKVWAVRKNGLGLILGIKGDRKPVAFIEDAGIPIKNLPEYIDQVLRYCKGRDVPVVMYAHASVGLIHVRPVLNLKSQTDIDNMKAIAEFSFQLVKKYGGSISGEHGDGRNRSPFLEKFFGEQLYSAFREVKNLFDPAGIMNPGIIIDPNPMDQDLRYGIKYKTPDIKTEYFFRDDGSFAHAVEMCNGVGACRQNLAGTMCPSYRATRDEEHSTRGRANALRLAMTGQYGPEGLSKERLFQVMELCLSCKACKAECPSNVDMAKLKSEFLQQYFDTHKPGFREKLVAGSSRTAAGIAGWKAPAVNFIQKTALFRYLIDWILKIDKRRKLPDYTNRPFPKWFSSRNGLKNLNRQVVLFDDTYMNYHEPQIGISAVELLESCGYNVILANAGCCQRPKISHGFLRDAKVAGKKTLQNLDRYIQKGLQIVVCEPGCASALTDDLPDLIDDQSLGDRIKNNVLMIDQFLAEKIKAGKSDQKFISPFEKILIHGHCHQKSLVGTTFMTEILDNISSVSVREIDSGCCGMAGSFGYEKEHYDLSMRVGEDRLFPAIRDREPETAVVACGFSCRHQIMDATGTKALHWVETLKGEC